VKIGVPLEELQKCKIFVATPMYGGQCSGTFVQSIQALQTELKNAGVELQSYYLFNESLITRARNYCADEFLRSNATHLLFIDSDIGFRPKDVLSMLALSLTEPPNEYDILGGPYPKKSLPGSALVLTEDGEQPIKKLVSGKYSGKVLSLSEDGSKLEFKRVVSHSRFRPASPKRWVKLVTEGVNKRKQTMTHDHECAIVRDALRPTLDWLAADNIDGCYVVRKPGGSGFLSENLAYSSQQISFLVGTLLGDASVKKNGQVAVVHSAAFREYAELKASIFGGEVRDRVIESFGGKFKASGFYTPVNAQTKLLRSLLYKNGKKEISSIVDLIDEAALSFWYMDDGFTRSSNGIAHLCTECFSSSDIDLLISKLRGMGFDPSTFSYNGGTRLRFKRVDSDRLLNIVSRYAPDCMLYKIPESLRSPDRFDYSSIQRLPYSIARVRAIEEASDQGDQYDIGVEDNHNFIVSGYVVHNCISWEKIRLAVDKGYGDPNNPVPDLQNPDILSNFVGDYVFNLAHGKTNFDVQKPAEVLELGTGFMLIRRETLLKFAEAYPNYRIRPDHVRTQHFDGKRLITQFFQAEIDQPDPYNEFSGALERIAAGTEQFNAKAEAAAAIRRYKEAQEKATRRYLSEDYWFCQKARAVGLKTWLCPWVKLAHVGTYSFGGSIQDLANIGAPMTASPEMLMKPGVQRASKQPMTRKEARRAARPKVKSR